MELSPTNDIIKALEGELVHVKCKDRYEILDVFEVNGDELYMLNNRCSINTNNISTIQWVSDINSFDEENTFYGLKESTREH